MEITNKDGKVIIEADEKEMKDFLDILNAIIETSNYDMLDPLDTTVPDLKERIRLQTLRETFFKQIKDYHQKLKKKG